MPIKIDKHYRYKNCNVSLVQIAYKIGDCNKSATGNIVACVSDIKSIPKKVPVCLNVVSFAFKFTYKPVLTGRIQRPYHAVK